MNEKERWLTALSYFFSPIFPAVLLFIIDLDDNPFLKSHIYQALVMGVVFVLFLPFFMVVTLGVGGLFWLIMPYWAALAFNGQNFQIPFVSAWIKRQGWGI